MNRYMTIDDKLIKFPFEIPRTFIDKYMIMKKDNKSNNLSMYL